MFLREKQSRKHQPVRSRHKTNPPKTTKGILRVCFCSCQVDDPQDVQSGTRTAAELPNSADHWRILRYPAHLPEKMLQRTVQSLLSMESCHIPFGTQTCNGKSRLKMKVLIEVGDVPFSIAVFAYRRVCTIHIIHIQTTLW